MTHFSPSPSPTSPHCPQVELRRKPVSERRVAVLLYGFPPGVGATGTAALLNVPRSLEALFSRLQAEGYDLGGVNAVQAATALAAAAAAGGGAEGEGDGVFSGEALVSGLKLQEDQRVISLGEAGVHKKGAGPAAASGVKVRVRGEGRERGGGGGQGDSKAVGGRGPMRGWGRGDRGLVLG